MKNTRILITAGPTWVAIDRVRVISNIATGETGVLLSEALAGLGAKVTLLLGPAALKRNLDKRIKIIPFLFFDDLKRALSRELSRYKYDWVIHSAAVSDFRPRQAVKGKIASDRPYNLKLARLPKIAKSIKLISPRVKLVLFKLESGISDIRLIDKARKTMIQSSADLIVANKVSARYKAFILDKGGIYCRSASKKDMTENLIALLKNKIRRPGAEQVKLPREK